MEIQRGECHAGKCAYQRCDTRLDSLVEMQPQALKTWWASPVMSTWEGLECLCNTRSKCGTVTAIYVIGLNHHCISLCTPPFKTLNSRIQLASAGLINTCK